MDLSISPNKHGSLKSSEKLSSDKRSVLSKLSKLSVASLYEKLGIKGSLLGDNEDMKCSREEQIKKYQNIRW